MADKRKKEMPVTEKHKSCGCLSLLFALWIANQPFESIIFFSSFFFQSKFDVTEFCQKKVKQYKD